MSCHEPVKARGALVSCGYCPGCRAKRSASWAIRLEDEEKVHSRSSFVTLTVADLPANEFLCTDRPVPWALNRRYLQLFFKLLRFRGNVVKYYAVGEYGEKKARAHYHVLLFGLDQRDRELIEECWPWGSVDIGRIEPASIRYVTGYVMKAPLGRLRLHAEREGNAPPFSVMSRAIGATSARARTHTITTQGVIYVGNKMVSPPRFYVRRLSSDDASRFRDARRRLLLTKALQRVADVQDYQVNNVLDRAKVSRADFNARKKARGSL